MRRASKMSSEGNKAKRKKAEFRVEWLNTALECDIIIRDDATGIPKRDEHGLESESDWSWSRFLLICDGVGLESESIF